jgi:Sec-independent protein translocase protein TatA
MQKGVDPIGIGVIALGVVMLIVLVVISNNQMPQAVARAADARFERLGAQD